MAEEVGSEASESVGKFLESAVTEPAKTCLTFDLIDSAHAITPTKKGALEYSLKWSMLNFLGHHKSVDLVAKAHGAVQDAFRGDRLCRPRILREPGQWFSWKRVPSLLEVQGEDCGRQETTNHRERSRRPSILINAQHRILTPCIYHACLPPQAEVLSSLSHRNIVQFFGAVTVAPNYCIATGITTN